jgi:integrase
MVIVCNWAAPPRPRAERSTSVAYRHGLRARELCELTWNMIQLDSGRIHVRRAKNGVDSTHPLDSPG